MFKTGVMDVSEAMKSSRGYSSYPWDSQPVGGYFVATAEQYPNARSTMSRRNKRNPEQRFISRTVDGEFRFVRVR